MTRFQAIREDLPADLIVDDLPYVVGPCVDPESGLSAQDVADLLACGCPSCTRMMQGACRQVTLGKSQLELTEWRLDGSEWHGVPVPARVYGLNESRLADYARSAARNGW